ncbi:MAG: ABC-F family ATP-binding cassette domain-containing protein [Clostridiales bacterium]|nr:ABC-F family ATP-binding cassette domain-containing protein [Clostridiales bacterium]
MNLLTIDNISKSYTERLLFDKVTLGIHEGDKIGIIGINGTGKSTLLKIIAGLEEPDEGTVTQGKTVRIGYLPQTPEFDNDLSILANVVINQKAEEEYRNLEGEARAMLAKLGINDPSNSPEFLSGGQKKRVALVRTLLTPADILVLDEPTNHLDNEMAEWLEDYLTKYRGAFIMVTHDRYFLDKVTNKIVEIDKGQIYQYEANFSKFIELKAQREDMMQATERKAKSLYRMELEWMKRGARARSTKQKARIERFEDLKNRGAIEEDGKVEINALSARMGKKTIELDSIDKAYDNVLIKEFTYIFLPDDRIGIIGPNGCGKTTLLKIITQNLEPDSGTMEIGSTIKIGYFSQENEYMDNNLRVIDYVKETAEFIQTSEGSMSASMMCERFLFTGSMQYSFIGKLSGGEKRRLYLLKILMEAPNVLILDEPTNDLDIYTLAVLEEYLETFPGIVISVSHDRYFLDKMATRIFAFEGEGTIKQYEGNFSDYKETKGLTGDDNIKVEDVIDTKEDEKKTENIANWKQKDAKLKFTYKEQKEYETIDEDIEKLELEIEETDNAAALAATDYAKLGELMNKKEELEKALEDKMDRWVYLNDLAEKIEGQKG